MTARRPVGAVLVLAMLLVGAGDCDPGGSDSPRPRPGAGDVGQQHPAGGQQPAPVQGDPSAHNTQPGEVDLHVEWIAENRSTPVCEWSKNGVSQPCANMEHGVKEPGLLDYIGFWEWEEHGVAGDVFTLTAQGTGAFKDVSCTITWKGKYFPGVANGRRCGIRLVLA